MKTLFASDDHIGWLPIILLAAALLLAGCNGSAHAQPAPKTHVATTTELIASPGPIVRAATAPSTAPAPATQPTPAPIIGRIWHVANLDGESDNGDGTAQHPLSLGTAIRILRNGDELLLKGGDTFGNITCPKGIRDITIGSYGSGRALIDAPTGLLILQGGGVLEVRDIDFTDSTRNPTRPNMVPHQGGMNVTFRDCQTAKVWLHDCSFQWAYINIDIESTAPQQGTLIENCDIGPSYNPPGRAQGIFDAGQVGMIVRNCRFVHCGWWPGIAPATNQSHSVYHHWDAQNPGGPITITGCVFVDSAAGGPTSNSGGTFDSNILIDCAHDGSGMAAWGSGDNWTFTNNVVVGGWINAIAKNCTIAGNTFINPGTFAINIGTPAQSVNWRAATNVVNSDHNSSFGGAPQVVRQFDLGGGRFQTLGSDAAFPASPLLEALVRQAAKARAGQ